MRPQFTHNLELTPGKPLPDKSLPAAPGVYLVCDETDRPILLSFSANLRRVVGHRLAAPEPDIRTKRVNLAEIARRLYWIETHGSFETLLTHWQQARELYPREYRTLLGFGPAEFIRVDPTANTPRFTVTRELRPDGARYLGPLPTRKAADAWVDMLADLFDLCRYYDVLEKSPNGEACAYFDMGKCPAPCNGTIGLTIYRDMIASAWDFSVGQTVDRLVDLRKNMQAAATKLEFERAGSIRGTIERAESLRSKSDYRHMADLGGTAWLVIQRACSPRRVEKNTLVRPYIVSAREIHVGEPVLWPDIGSIIGEWIQRTRDAAAAANSHPASASDTAASERIWLLSRFLFQNEKAPGWFGRFDQLPSEEDLIVEIRERLIQQSEQAYAAPPDEVTIAPTEPPANTEPTAPS